MRLHIRSVFGFLAISAGLIVAAGNDLAAQDPLARPDLAAPPAVPAQLAPPFSTRAAEPASRAAWVQRNALASRPTRTNEFQRELRKAMQVLRDAESGEAKDAAREALQKTLGDFFDSDLEKRRTELTRLVKRADDTEALLKTRQSSRSELIDLQMKSYTYAADGLSLFGNAEPVAPECLGRSPFATVTPNLASQWPTSYVVSGGGTPAVRKPKDDPRREAMEEVHKHWNNLSGIDWEDRSDKKQKVVDQLREALGSYFDADLNYRREELTKVRDGLAKMENGIEKRVDARQDIIALQLQVSENEAMGLGFFENSGRVTSGWSTANGSSPFGVSNFAAEPGVRYPTQPGVLSTGAANGTDEPATRPVNPSGRR